MSDEDSEWGQGLHEAECSTKVLCSQVASCRRMLEVIRLDFGVSPLEEGCVDLGAVKGCLCNRALFVVEGRGEVKAGSRQPVAV